MRLFAIAFVLFTSPGMAQEKTASWTIRAAALDIAGDHHTLWLRAGPGKSPIEVPLNIHSFSTAIEFKGLAKVGFYASEIEASAEEPPAPLASAILSAKSSLLVFAPREGGKRYQAYAISEGEFPFGSFRLVNLSKAAVRAELGSEAVTLKPGAAQTFAYREAQDALAVRILAVANGEKPRVIRQSSWSIFPDQRELVFFFPNSGNGLVRTRHFVDSRDEDAQPGT